MIDMMIREPSGCAPFAENPLPTVAPAEKNVFSPSLARNVIWAALTMSEAYGW